MITCRAISYLDQDFALTADWTVATGRFVAVLGASGAGKSTLLSVISGFEHSAAGQVILNGQDVTHHAAAQRPVSLVFQDNNTFPHLDIWTNVALGISASLRLTADEKVAVDQALDKVGLAHLRLRKPGEISGGELQRVALARVLVRDKPILLLDEAFSGLGPGKRHDMLSLVKTLHQERGLTTLMVTHQPEDARAFADEVIFVANGKARAPVASDEFFGGARDADMEDYLGNWR